MAIGEILLAQDRISEDQLEDALVHQKFFSGKTGSQLVDLGFLNPLELEEALSIQFGVPSAEEQDLKYLDEFCRHQFPIEIIIRYQMIPLALVKNCLAVAMTRPFDEEALKMLGKTLGKKEVRIFCMSEIRFHYYLFQHFQKGSDTRLRNLYFRYMKDRCKKVLHANNNFSEQEFLLEDPIFGMDSEAPPTLFTDPKQLEALGLKPLGKNEELSGKNHEEWLQMQSILGTQGDSQPSPKKDPTSPSQPKEYTPEFADLADFGV